ncbi:MAG: hypothetical protein KC592_09545 [Nitrospira sp.]|nr:hypothetical protein [Nitrospira sp.]
MRDERTEQDPSDQCDRSKSNQWKFFTVGLMLLLLVPAAPTIVIADTVGGVLCKIVSFGLGCRPFSAAEPVPVAATCTLPTMNGVPQFLSQPKGTAKYPFGGGCSSPDKPGIQMKYRWEGSWTPSERDEKKPNASESIEITGYEPFLPDRAPGGKISMYWVARCNHDPWLRPETSGGCRRLGESIPPDLREAVPDLMKQGFPQTINIIPPGERQRLLAEYTRVNLKPAILSTPGGGAASSTPSQAFSPGPPKILSPLVGQRFFAQSTVPIKLGPPTSVAATNYEVVIQRKDTKGNWIEQHRFPIGATEAQSPGGYQGFGAGGKGPTKSPVLLTTPGPWRLQARVLQPNPMAWSDWLGFLVEPPLTKGAILQTPSQGIGAGPGLIPPNTTGPGQLMRPDTESIPGKQGSTVNPLLKKQSPSPNSSILQTPQKGMSEEPQIFLPQTGPSQGVGGTELLRSRGIGENDSKDSASDPEKKP